MKVGTARVLPRTESSTTFTLQVSYPGSLDILVSTDGDQGNSALLIVALVFISKAMKLAFNSLSFPKLFFYNFFWSKSPVVTYICLKTKAALWLGLECRIIHGV